MSPRRAPRPLTSLQAQVLGCVGECGPCDAFEVARNLPIGVERARRVCNALEERGLLGRDYTARRYQGRYGYAITVKGRAEALAIFGDEEPTAAP